jgi:hypothetical protein
MLTSALLFLRRSSSLLSVPPRSSGVSFLNPSRSSSVRWYVPHFEPNLTFQDHRAHPCCSVVPRVSRLAQHGRHPLVSFHSVHKTRVSVLMSTVLQVQLRRSHSRRNLFRCRSDRRRARFNAPHARNDGGTDFRTSRDLHHLSHPIAVHRKSPQATKHDLVVRNLGQRRPPAWTWCLKSRNSSS